jgi:hypothetical protein
VARHGLIAALLGALLASAALLAPSGPLAPSTAHAREELFPGTAYGGGWVGAERQLWLRAVVDETGRSVRFRGHFEASCASASIASDPVPAEALDGPAVTGTTRDGAVTTRWRLTGRLGASDGSGALEATVRVRRGGRTVRRCSVTGRPWVLSTGASSASTTDGVPAPGSRWYGTLDGGGTLAVVVSRTRSELATVALSMDLGFCPRRPSDDFWAVVRRVPFDAQGYLDGVVRDTIRVGGLVRRVRITLFGGFSQGRLSPLVMVREVVRSARTGRRLWACDTETLSGDASLLPRG